MSGSLGPINLIGLILLGGAMLWTVQLVYSSRRTQGYDQALVGLTVAAWVLIFLGAFGLLGSAIFGIPLILYLIVIAAMAVDRYRTSERKVLLASMAVAVEKGYPLAPAVRAFADERSDELGRRAYELAGLLEAGMSLPDALEKSCTYLPTGSLLAVNLHATSGGFAEALREAARPELDDDPVWQTLLIKSMYLVALLIFAYMLYTGILIFIVPTFREIMLDFDVETPALTQWVFDLAGRAQLIAAISVFPLLLLVIAYGIGVLHYMGWIDWDMPGVNWMMRRVDSGHVLKALAQGIEQGRPLDRTLGLIAESYPRRMMRGLLGEAYQSVAAGGDWCAALEKAGVIDSAETALLHSAQRAGNLPWALREAAEGGLRRLMLRLHFVVNIGLPAALLLLAVPVGLCKIGLMWPLAILINSLAQ